MSSRIKYDGLDELKAFLRALPTELVGEAGGIVHQHSEAAAEDIRNAYPEFTGNLKSRVYVTHGSRGQFGAAAVVASKSPHAWLFENGSQTRSFRGRDRGRMPPGRVFVPRVAKHRRAMYDELKAMMAAHGLRVSGEA